MMFLKSSKSSPVGTDTNCTNRAALIRLVSAVHGNAEVVHNKIDLLGITQTDDDVVDLVELVLSQLVILGVELADLVGIVLLHKGAVQELAILALDQGIADGAHEDSHAILNLLRSSAATGPAQGC